MDFTAPACKAVARRPIFQYYRHMELHLTAETEKKLKDLAAKTGRKTDAIVEDVMAGYFDEMQHIRETLNGRYDEITSGRVKPVDGDQFFESLRRRKEDLLNSRSSE
jgi:predicted DNA-binding protein